MEFLKQGTHPKHYEVETILQQARQLDDTWILDRENCNPICETARTLVELSQKYRLKRWSTKTGSKYSKTHDLWELHKELMANLPYGITIVTCKEASLKYITQCGEPTKYLGVKIPCRVFYDHMTTQVDPYLLHLWEVMKHPHTVISPFADAPLAVA